MGTSKYQAMSGYRDLLVLLYKIYFYVVKDWNMLWLERVWRALFLIFLIFFNNYLIRIFTFARPIKIYININFRKR